MLKFDPFSSNVTLKIRARSANQIIIPQCFINANLIPICSLVYEISCTQESITPTPMISAPKQYVCPHRDFPSPDLGPYSAHSQLKNE